jgi:hypothetical protein
VHHPLTDTGFRKFLADWDRATPELGKLPPSYLRPSNPQDEAHNSVQGA